MPMLRADGSSESVVEELPVVEEVEPDDEAVDAAEDAAEAAVDAVELPDEPLLLLLLVPLLLPVLLLVASLSVTGGGVYAIERISMAILRISARANCDRSISSRPREVIFHD